MRRAEKLIRAAIALALILLASAPARAAELSADLYTAKAVVTGTGEKNRQPGLAETFERVLVKVSGDPRLIGDPRLVEMARHAGAYVEAYRYRDRLEGIPIHDEQGSYDRPHDLTVTFKPDRIDAALRDLGRRPWLAPRPKLLVVVSVSRGGKELTVIGDGARDADMRTSLMAAAELVGLSVRFPDYIELAKAGLSPDGFRAADAVAPRNKAAAIGPEPVLFGSLDWSDEALGWIADWRIDVAGNPVRWQVRGVGYDDAFRNGLAGALQALSGNGQPG